MVEILQGDCAEILPTLSYEKYRLIYVDPPFNTGNRQEIHGISYNDAFDDYLQFLMPRLEMAIPLMTSDGSLFVHLDHHEVHYVKVALDRLMGRDSFMNEIIWSYDYGGRSKRKWPCKHDTILWYAKNPKDYVFNYDAIDRIPYMAPDLVGPEKAARGKTPTDVWWSTIVPTQGKERVGYPTQKPRKIIDRIINVHSEPGDWCLDFFAGSGTLGESACINGRNVTLVDSSGEAVRVMQSRLKEHVDGLTTGPMGSSTT